MLICLPERRRRAQQVPRRRKLTSNKLPAKPADIGRAKLLCLGDLDGRTVAAKRANTLVAELENDLGGDEYLSASQRVLVRRAAAAVAVAEHLEASWIAGHAIDVGALTTLTNTISRVCGQLGLERKPRDVTPTVAEFAAELAAEKAAAAAPQPTAAAPSTVNG
jgi:hypothetical protein